MSTLSILAADIGGTKSELAIFVATSSGVLQPLAQKRYQNAQFTGFETILRQFLDEVPCRPHLACLAVAGVVAGRRVQLTNLPWIIDCRELEKRYALRRINLINDLTAVAASLSHLGQEDLAEIQAGVRVEGEMRGIIAPGTGLGEGMLLLPDQGTSFARGSEGGHCDFAPVDTVQTALLAWMQKRHKPVSYESVIAGPGLASLYAFCKDYYQLQETALIARAMTQVADRIPIIIQGATEEQCPLCRKAVELFLSILGSETGNLALKLYARGGMYLGGGIVPRLFGKVPFNGFLESFRAKGLMTDFMARVPVQLILKTDAALLGAAHFGLAEATDS